MHVIICTSCGTQKRKKKEEKKGFDVRHLRCVCWDCRRWQVRSFDFDRHTAHTILPAAALPVLSGVESLDLIDNFTVVEIE